MGLKIITFCMQIKTAGQSERGKNSIIVQYFLSSFYEYAICYSFRDVV